MTATALTACTRAARGACILLSSASTHLRVGLELIGSSATDDVSTAGRDSGSSAVIGGDAVTTAADTEALPLNTAAVLAAALAASASASILAANSAPAAASRKNDATPFRAVLLLLPAAPCPPSLPG
eukprot:9376-Heterococcus_DN1.PRE.4